MKTEGGAHITTISQGVISNFYLLGKEEPVSSNVSSLVRGPCFSGRPQPRVSGQRTLVGQKGRRRSQCEMGRERGLGLMRAGGGEVNMIKITKFSKGENV